MESKNVILQGFPFRPLNVSELSIELRTELFDWIRLTIVVYALSRLLA